MQPVGGGAPRPGRGVGFPGSRRQLDSAALLMLLVDADRPEPVRSGARELALFLTPEPGAEVRDGVGSGGGGSWGCGIQGSRSAGEEWTSGDPLRAGPGASASPQHSLVPGAGAPDPHWGSEGSFLCGAVAVWRRAEMRVRSRPPSPPAPVLGGPDSLPIPT